MGSIDFAEVVRRADLRALVEADIGPPDRGRKWLCPFHADTRPSLGLTPDESRFKCWSCQASGTALDWVMQREGLTVVEAAKRLDPTLSDDAPGRPRKASKARSKPVAVDPPCPAVEAHTASHDPEWQADVDELICRAEGRLWGPAGRPVLDWLRGRGFKDFTIKRHRLGYVPEGFRTPRRGLYVARGAVFPWVRPGSWYGDDPEADPGLRWVGANVRQLAPDPGAKLPEDQPKYLCVAGSERGHPFPHADLCPGLPVLIAEGEIDALLSWQEVGWISGVLSVGSATQGPRPTALESLKSASPWLVAMDADRAGAGGFAAWRKVSPKAKRLLLPPGSGDIGEIVATGGDVRAWLRSEYDRLGLGWPG